MKEVPQFRLDFIKQEKHLLLPNVASIIVVQNLYDVLFQYVINNEKEQKLKHFIKLLETHIKSKPKAPFSMPVEDLAFLDEGLQELRLLNWMEVPVSLCELSLKEDSNNEESKEQVLNFLQDILTFNIIEGTDKLYVYPGGITKY